MVCSPDKSHVATVAEQGRIRYRNASDKTIQYTFSDTPEPTPITTVKSILAVALIGWLACSRLLAGEPASAASDLFQAIHAGDRGAVRTLLKNGADVNAPQKIYLNHTGKIGRNRV